MKLIQTGRPRSAARSTVPPPTWGRRSSGAAWPTWKLALAAVALAEPGAGDDDGDGEAKGAGEAAGEAVRTGADGAGSGARSTMATTINAAASTPDRSPATIGRRVGTAGEYQYEGPPAPDRRRC